jgi:hypothetical protein
MTSSSMRSICGLSSAPSLCTEDKPRSYGRVNDFIAQFISGEVVEAISGAMAGNQVIRIDLLQGRDDLSHVVVVVRRNDMEAMDTLFL